MYINSLHFVPEWLFQNLLRHRLGAPEVRGEISNRRRECPMIQPQAESLDVYTCTSMVIASSTGYRG